MSVHGKKYKEKLKLVDRNKLYNVGDALSLLRQCATAKFDETVELSIKVGVNLKKSDQNVRGTVMLPEGTGKSVRIVVIAKGDKQREATESNADFVGDDDIIQKIMGGWIDFDVVIATPDIMSSVGKLGKILGTKGLMPNPKSGTVTFDIGKAVKEFKMGKVEFKMDKGGCLHIPLGRVSFSGDKLESNLKSAVNAVLKAKPSSVKGTYIKSLNLCSTMGPGIKLNTSELIEVA